MLSRIGPQIQYGSNRFWWLALTFLLVVGFRAELALAQNGEAETARPPFDPEDLEIEVEGPQGPIRVGDPATIRVTVGFPPGIQLATVQPINPGRLELVDFDINEATTASRRVAESTLTFVSYRPGIHDIEAFSIEVADVEGTVYERRVPGVSVRVASLLANENAPELRTEKDGLAVYYRDYTLAWAAGIGSALVAMILVGFFIARNRPRQVVEPPPPPPRPAHEIALERLDRIAAEQWIEKGETMAFYVRLSEAVREYLGNRYRYHALEMTTTEIMSWLRAIWLPPEVSHEFVAHLLYECDLVKFAKFGTSPEEQREALDNAYLLVRSTMAPDREVEPPKSEPARRIQGALEVGGGGLSETPVHRSSSGQGAAVTGDEGEAGPSLRAERGHERPLLDRAGEEPNPEEWSRPAEPLDPSEGDE